jgi:predicted nucleic acid-binding Zn finger protein
MNLEKRQKRAHSLAAMGLVKRDGEKFVVSTPSLRGNQKSYNVSRTPEGKIKCTCLEFEAETLLDPGFRCEHILAVKEALVRKNFTV